MVQSIRECLSNFAAARRGNADLLDETRVKEVAVIEMLEHQAEDMATRVNSRAGSPVTRGGAGTTEAQDIFPRSSLDDPSFESLFDIFWGGGGAGGAEAVVAGSALSMEGDPAVVPVGPPAPGSDWTGGRNDFALDWSQLATLFDTSGTAGLGS